MNKTRVSKISVAEFTAGIKDETRHHDAERLTKIMQKITGKKPVMWGSSIVGFGQYHYKYESGREGDMAAAGFSPRAANLTVYFVDGVSNYPELLAKLGPHKTGKACLYIKHLADVDLEVLELVIKKSYHYVTSKSGHMHHAT